MMTVPSTFLVPGGPPSRRWPGPKRRMSIALVSPASGLGASSTLPATRALRPHRRLGRLVARLAERARAPELLVVRLDIQREAVEPNPDERPDADDQEEQDEQEIPVEDDGDEDEAEGDHSGPQQPFLHRAQDLVAMQLTDAHVVQNDRADEEGDRRDRYRQPDVRKVVLRELHPAQVVERPQMHACPSQST